MIEHPTYFFRANLILRNLLLVLFYTNHTTLTLPWIVDTGINETCFGIKNSVFLRFLQSHMSKGFQKFDYY